MPAKLSKFAIKASCIEYAHPWSSSCISTTAGLGLQALQDSLKTYSTLYFITLLTKGRVPTVIDIKKTFSSIIQSTAFLSWSAFAYSMFICLFRRILGHFNILTVSFLPSFFSSLTAIILERPSRRTMLCLYVSNIATEALFRMAVSRGYISTVPRGEIYIFAAGMATLLYFYRSKNNNSDSIFKIIRNGLGPFEENGYQYRNENQSRTSESSYYNKKMNVQRKTPLSIFNLVQKSLKIYEQIIMKIKKLGGRHPSCPHPNSCIYYSLEGGCRMFGFGLCLQVALKVIFQIRKIMQNQNHLKEILFKKETLKLACFFGGFAALYKSVSCFLRRANNKDSPQYAIIAGLIASTSFVICPDNTVALYVAWKALQLLWNRSVEKGQVPEVKWFVILLYCFSTAVLFHAAIVEPQNLRSSYWKFLNNLSGGRIASMSRIPIDQFGLESSKHLQEVFKKTGTHDKYNFSF